MALTAMSTVTKEIFYDTWGQGPETVRTNGTDIKPGHALTDTGETVLLKDVDLPGAADEIFAGIAGLLPNQDIDIAYGDNIAIPMWQKSTDAIVFAWITANDGDKASGAPLQHGGTALLVAGELVNEFAGYAYLQIDVDASNDTPALVRLG